MGADRAFHAAAEAPGSPAQGEPAGGRQRHPLNRDDRVPVGDAAEGLGDLRAPGVELGVHVLDVADVPQGRARSVAGQEEVLPDMAIGALDLALRLGPVGPAGPRAAAIVAKQLRIPTDPNSGSSDIRTWIPVNPYNTERRC